MVNKKGYMKTLEAVLALVIFLIFITVALVFNKVPEDAGIPHDIEALQDSILTKLENEPSLRTCIINNQIDCINQTINPLVPNQTTEYFFELCITDTPSDCSLTQTFPEEITIYSDSMIIQEANETAIFRLFLWKKL